MKPSSAAIEVSTKLAKRLTNQVSGKLEREARKLIAETVDAAFNAGSIDKVECALLEERDAEIASLKDRLLAAEAALAKAREVVTRFRLWVDGLVQATEFQYGQPALGGRQTLAEIDAFLTTEKQDGRE